MKIPLIDEETKGLFAVGFITPLDLLFMATELGTGLVTLLLSFTGYFGIGNIIAMLLCMLFMMSTWALTVAYRACYFILKTHAAIELMPEAAAKMATASMMNVASSAASEKLNTLE